jgi:hypothetical protein
MVLEILSRPGDYRGITITSSVGKVFNSILNERLDSFLKQNNIIDDCQIGFTRKAHSQNSWVIYVLQRYNLQPMIVDICHETDRN